MLFYALALIWWSGKQVPDLIAATFKFLLDLVLAVPSFLANLLRLTYSHERLVCFAWTVIGTLFSQYYFVGIFKLAALGYLLGAGQYLLIGKRLKTAILPS